MAKTKTPEVINDIEEVEVLDTVSALEEGPPENKVVSSMENGVIKIPIESSSFQHQYGYELTKEGLSPNIGSAPKICRLIFVSMSSFLARRKSKSNPVAIVMEDFKGNFLMAGYVSYNEAPEETDDVAKGNWAIEFTFNEEDIKGFERYETSSIEFTQTVEECSLQVLDGRFKTLKFMQIAITTLISLLIEFLKTNTNPGCVTDIIVENCAVFSTEVENDKIFMSITPDAIIKQAIKDDITA